MCPFCLATAAWIAGSIAVTGGLTAVALSSNATRKTQKSIPTNSPTKEDRNG